MTKTMNSGKYLRLLNAKSRVPILGWWNKRHWVEIKIKVTVTFSLEEAMKAESGSRGIALLFLKTQR